MPEPSADHAALLRRAWPRPIPAATSSRSAGSRSRTSACRSATISRRGTQSRPTASLTGPFQKLPVLHWGDRLIAETLMIAAFAHEASGDAGALSDDDNLRHGMLTSSLCLDMMNPIAILLWAEVMYPGADVARRREAHARSSEGALPGDRAIVRRLALARPRTQSPHHGRRLPALGGARRRARRVRPALVAGRDPDARAVLRRVPCSSDLRSRCSRSARARSRHGPSEAEGIAKIQQLLG